MHRRPTLGLEMFAPGPAGERADRHGRVGRAEGGRADRRDVLAEGLGHQGQADDIAVLALVGRHAERRVALQMLDRDIALAMRRGGHRRGDVVLRVDEALQFAARNADLVDGSERRARRRSSAIASSFRPSSGAPRCGPRRRRRRPPRRPPPRRRSRSARFAVGAAGRSSALRSSQTGFTPRWDSRFNDRRPAARDRDQIRSRHPVARAPAACGCRRRSQGRRRRRRRRSRAGRRAGDPHRSVNRVASFADARRARSRRALRRRDRRPPPVRPHARSATIFRPGATP